jgi:hypothetical protein
MAKSTMADHGPRSAADPITDSYSLTAVVVRWKDVRFPLLRAGYYPPRSRNPEPGPGADGPGYQSRTLCSRQKIFRRRVLVPSIHDLDGEEDVAANALLLRVLLEKSDRYKYRALACQDFLRTNLTTTYNRNGDS